MTWVMPRSPSPNSPVAFTNWNWSSVVLRTSAMNSQLPTRKPKLWVYGSFESKLKKKMRLEIGNRKSLFIFYISNSFYLETYIHCQQMWMPICSVITNVDKQILFLSSGWVLGAVSQEDIKVTCNFEAGKFAAKYLFSSTSPYYAVAFPLFWRYLLNYT